VLRARVRHRRRGGSKFFVFVVHACAPSEQPHTKGARGRGDIDSQEDSSADIDDHGRTVLPSPGNARATGTVHASPGNARAAATRADRANPDNSGARTASFFSGASEVLPAQ
jgi:hypothetical protein